MADTNTIKAPLLDQNVKQPETPHNEALVVIDASIAGILDIDMSDADYTLKETNSDDSLSYPHEWQHKVLHVNVANTGAKNLIIPANKVMSYIVYNDASGFNITLKYSASTGVIVTNNTLSNIFCDGTECYKVI